MTEFNPNSTDAVIATIRSEALADRTDRAEFREEMRSSMDEIKGLQRATNGRVRSLERWRWFLTGGFIALTAPWAGKIAAIFSS